MSNPKLRCFIIRMPSDATSADDIQLQQVEFDTRGSSADKAWPERIARRERTSVKDLLPWADPYILKLIERCQKEVAAEREQRRMDRADREEFVNGWSSSHDSLLANPGEGVEDADDRNLFAGHPFGFEWEGEAVEFADQDFQPNEAYLRPVRKSK